MDSRLFQQNEKIIKDVFYNALVGHILDTGGLTQENSQHKLHMGIISTIQQVVMQSKHCDGIQLPGIVITSANCPHKYKELFVALLSLKNKDMTHHELSRLANQVVLLESFAEINPVQFLLEAGGQCVSHPQYDDHGVTADLIRETFYNEMVNQALDAHEKQWIKQAEFVECDPRIYIVLPALTILEALQQSTHCDGIRLLNGKVLTIQNCPQTESFPAFTKLALSLKEKIASLSKDQISAVKYILSSEDELPNELKLLKTPALMKSVADIKDIAIEISRRKFFHGTVQQVIQLCCDTLNQIEDPANKLQYNAH